MTLYCRWTDRFGGCTRGELSTQADEKAKITATVINTLAVAIIVAGCVAPRHTTRVRSANLRSHRGHIAPLGQF